MKGGLSSTHAPHWHRALPPHTHLILPMNCPEALCPSPRDALITLHLEYCHSLAGITFLLQPSLHSTAAKAGSMKPKPIPKPKTAPPPPHIHTCMQADTDTDTHTHARMHATHAHSGFNAQCSCLWLSPETKCFGECDGAAVTSTICSGGL